MINIQIDVPDLMIEVLVSPNRLYLTSKSKPIEVVAVEFLEDILSVNEISYVIKGVSYKEESIPYELEVVFNKLYSASQLNLIAEALQDILVSKDFKVRLFVK